MRTVSAEAQTTESISPVVTEVGKISWSIDGLGVYPGTAGTIQVEKPAGATVRSAYMAAASTGWSQYHFVPGSVEIDGNDVIWTTEIASDINSYNAWADVTSLVKAKIDAAPAGRVDFTITESATADIDGELLVVIFNDPSQTTDNTVILMFGAQVRTGDDFNIGLAEPLDLTDPNLALDFSLAISFSNQDTDDQYSIVDVNGVRMTTWAGGNDDSSAGMSNGNLFTVGGLDDSVANPADPYNTPVGNKRYDDELYSLLPFVETGDTAIQVHTQNPSMDDNILFAGLYIRSATAVVGKGIILSPVSATNLVGTTHTLTATVQDDAGNPVPDTTVTFTIVSGPHAGMTGQAMTNSAGQAQFTYAGSAEGTDTIVASIEDQTGTIYSNEATKTWKVEIPIPEFPLLALPVIGVIGLILMIGAARRFK
jgi:hypothetical protein